MLHADVADRVDAFVEFFPDAPAPANGALSGLSFGVKEVFEQAGRLTPLGLDFLGDRIGKTDATVIRQAEVAGARRVGTTRSTAMAITGETRTRNPRDPARTPGGSSAGSAAAVAAGLIDFAFGTQTVGSIVRPASYCGVPGMKPTFDTLSTKGVMPLSVDLDHTGLIAKDVATILKVFRALCPESLAAPPFQRVFVPELWFRQTPHPAVATALDTAIRLLADAGLASTRVALPPDVTASEADVLEKLLCRGIHDNHRAFLEAHAADAPRDLLDKAKAGAQIADHELAQLRTDRDAMRETMLKNVPEDAVLLMPSVIDLPPEIGSGTGLREPQRLFTLLGWPAISLPVCEYGYPHQHLSISVQLAARPGADLPLLELAQLIEDQIGAM
ncbi:amidase family protein [Halovulum sp. GXIMD14794]